MTTHPRTIHRLPGEREGTVTPEPAVLDAAPYRLTSPSPCRSSPRRRASFGLIGPQGWLGVHRRIQCYRLRPAFRVRPAFSAATGILLGLLARVRAQRTLRRTLICRPRSSPSRSGLWPGPHGGRRGSEGRRGGGQVLPRRVLRSRPGPVCDVRGAVLGLSGVVRQPPPVGGHSCLAGAGASPGARSAPRAGRAPQHPDLARPRAAQGPAARGPAAAPG